VQILLAGGPPARQNPSRSIKVADRGSNKSHLTEISASEKILRSTEGLLPDSVLDRGHRSGYLTTGCPPTKQRSPRCPGSPRFAEVAPQNGPPVGRCGGVEVGGADREGFGLARRPGSSRFTEVASQDGPLVGRRGGVEVGGQTLRGSGQPGALVHQDSPGNGAEQRGGGVDRPRPGAWPSSRRCRPSGGRMLVVFRGAVCHPGGCCRQPTRRSRTRPLRTHELQDRGGGGNTARLRGSVPECGTRRSGCDRPARLREHAHVIDVAPECGDRRECPPATARHRNRRGASA